MHNYILDDIIKYYKVNYEKIKVQELYKWKAVKHFQDTWDIEADNFAKMITEALSKTHNLMHSGSYYPRRMTIQLAEKQPERVRSMFRDLLYSDRELKDRMIEFREQADSLTEECYPKDDYSSYQDHRAIMVYLNLMYPEKHYLYKFTMFKNFAELIDYGYKPKAGDINNVFLFEGLCEFINEKIKSDSELIQLYEERKSIFNDEDLHLLVQDLIYSAQYYTRSSTLVGDTYKRANALDTIESDITFVPFKHSATKKKVVFKPSKN